MEKIYNYILNNDKIYEKDIRDRYIDLYEDTEDMLIDVDFLLKYMNKKMLRNNISRIGQKEFRKELMKRYGCCIITGNDYDPELQAAHIVPHSDVNNCDIDNGIILDSRLHTTFDKYDWSINPRTLRIEVKDNKGSITKYKNNKVNVNKSSIKYLEKHYKKFKTNNIIYE